VALQDLREWQEHKARLARLGLQAHKDHLDRRATRETLDQTYLPYGDATILIGGTRT
jgi:hypothetical protein